MSEKYHEDFHNYTKFWISEETYKVGEVKVKDSNHILENIEDRHVKNVILV